MAKGNTLFPSFFGYVGRTHVCACGSPARQGPRETSHHGYIHLPTGSGKSLLFQLAAMVSTGVTIVIVPLKALREQQVARATQLGLTTVVLRGADDDGDRDDPYERLDGLVSGAVGGPALLFCTPEMLGTNNRVRSAVAALHDAGSVDRVVVDEDHVIPQCGVDFRPLYRELGSLRRALFPTTPVTAMSAIATPTECAGFLDSFGFRADEVTWFRGSFARSMANVDYRLRRKDKALDIAAVVDCIRDERRGAGIVYCLTRRDCDAVAEGLRRAGFQAEAFHSQLTPAQKKQRLKQWSEDGVVQILVGTDSIGMGIHKLDVRFVVHMSPPLSVSSHHQQCGRAGRDGAPARIWLLHHPADFAKGLQVIRHDAGKIHMLSEMHRHCYDGRRCSRSSVVAASGAPDDPAMACGGCAVCTADPDTQIDVTNALAAALIAVIRATSSATPAVVSEASVRSAVAKALRGVLPSPMSAVHSELIFALKRFGVVRSAVPSRRGWVSLGTEAELQAAISDITVLLDFGRVADVSSTRATWARHESVSAADSVAVAVADRGVDSDDEAAFFSSASGDDDGGGSGGGGDGPPTPTDFVSTAQSPRAAATSAVGGIGCDFVLQWIMHSAASRHRLPAGAFRDVEPALCSRLALHRKIAILNRKIADMTGSASLEITDGAWSSADSRFITFHARMEHTSGAGLQIVPRSPELSRTPKRFHSKYGADRFVQVSVPTELWRDCRQLDRIASADWHFAGRVWQLLTPQGECDGFALRFFAVSGAGIPTVPVVQVRDWHIPPTGANAAMTVAKYCSRFSLGFSDAVPTVVVQPAWIEVEHDPVSEDTGNVMTDGCCGISRRLLQRVEGALGADCTAFQGRLGSAKGMFYLDDRLPGMKIMLRKSMVKYDLGQSATEDQLTIEVCSVVSKPMRPARFNTQMVRLLAARGVPASLFLDAQEVRLNAISAALVDDAALEAMLVEHRGHPEAAAVRAALDAGFNPGGWLAMSLRVQFVAAVLDVNRSDPVKLLQPKDASRCKILADPTATLEPNQCYVRVPGGRGLITGKVLLCRNPCYHPGELLLLDAVCPTGGDQAPLQLLESTVTLSVRGPTPPAQHMQGGDYDGDEVVVIWNENLVSQVTPFAPPRFSDASAGPTMLAVADCHHGGLIEAEMIRHWIRSMEQAKLGYLSKLHGKWADLAHDNWAAAAAAPGRNAIELAELIFHQMDAWKSGFSLAVVPHHLTNPPVSEGRSINEQLRAKHDAAIALVAECDCGRPELERALLHERWAFRGNQGLVGSCYRELMDGYVQLKERHRRAGAVPTADDQARLRAGTRLLTARVRGRLFGPQLSKEQHMAHAVGFAQEEANKKLRRWDDHENGAYTRLSPLVHMVCGDLINECAEAAYLWPPRYS